MASDSHAKRPIVVERRKEKGRKKTPRLTKTYDVKIIPATVGVVAETEEPPKKRVAAYCRVSTDQEAQETSLEEQMAHFNTVIAEHPNWELAGIRPKQQRLIPLRKGVLLGFVPIRPTWKAVSFKRLETATEKVMALVDVEPEQVHIEYESEEYLPYEKGVYFPKEAPVEKISVGAERQRRYRAVRKLRTEPTEEHLWEVVLLYSGVRFKTYSGLPFTYEIRKGRNGQYTKELWIDRRENSKSLAWSSVLLALNNIKEVGAVVDRPKALGDIRGVTYIYGMFYRFGLIDMPDKVNGKMKRAGRQM